MSIKLDNLDFFFSQAGIVPFSLDIIMMGAVVSFFGNNGELNWPYNKFFWTKYWTLDERKYSQELRALVLDNMMNMRKNCRPAAARVLSETMARGRQLMPLKLRRNDGSLLTRITCTWPYIWDHSSSWNTILKCEGLK